MAKITVLRTEFAMPPDLGQVSHFLFRCLDGFTKEDRRSWHRFWRRFQKLEPGEMATCEMAFPRSGPFHRLHMALEQQIFDSQERFGHFEQFRNWLKIGAGHVDWVPGPRGAVVPIPRSISYTAMDDEEFKTFHAAAIEFLRTPHAGKVLWPNLSAEGRADMVETLLEEF